MAYTTIDDPSAHHQTDLYTGTGSTLSITNDGNSDLQPDLVWIKSRSSGSLSHRLYDSSRGAAAGDLRTHGTNGETQETGDLESFDSILIIETLEHIPEKLFKPVYDKIKTEFTGLFIITNWIHYHPIFFKMFQTEWEHPHCRHVDDNLYDRWSNDAKRVSHRYGSHIVLEY